MGETIEEMDEHIELQVEKRLSAYKRETSDEQNL